MLDEQGWRTEHTNCAIYFNRSFCFPRKWKNKKVIECLVQMEKFNPKQNLQTIIDEVKATWTKDFQGQSSVSFLEASSCRGIWSLYFELEGDLASLRSYLAGLDLEPHQDLMINSL